MNTLPRLAVALALLTTTVQAQEPTLTLSNGKVFNATMVEGMAEALASVLRAEKLRDAVLDCYTNAWRQGWTVEVIEECLEGTEKLNDNYMALREQADSQLTVFMGQVRAVESIQTAEGNDTIAASGHWRDIDDQAPVGSVTLSTGYHLPAAVVEVIYWDWITVTLIVEAKDGQLLCLIAQLKSGNDLRAVQTGIECLKPFAESITDLKTQHEEADRKLVKLAQEMGIK